MKQLPIGTLIAAFAGIATFSVSSSVFAQQACGGDTCEPGFECQISDAPCAAACSKTDDGELICEEFECEPEQYFYCARSACETSADCGDVMVCHTFEEQECSSGVSVNCEDDGCEEVEQESSCTSYEFKQCAYRHELPCESDAQCGEGFACVETQSCWCEGSTGESTDEVISVPPSGEPQGDDEGSDDSDATDEAGDDSDEVGDATDESPDETPGSDGDVNCGCEPSGENHCQANAIECDADADCPSGWTCEAGPETCWADQNGVGGCETLPANCYPPGGGGDNGSSPGGVTEPSDGDDYPDEDEWSEEHGAGSGGTDEDTSDDGANNDDDGQPQADLTNFWSLLGCSVKHTPGSTNSGALAGLVAAFGVALMRRRQVR